MAHYHAVDDSQFMAVPLLSLFNHIIVSFISEDESCSALNKMVA